MQGYFLISDILKRLDIDYIDMILIHWPGVAKFKNDDLKIQDVRLGKQDLCRNLESSDRTKEAREGQKYRGVKLFNPSS